jgi:hypothetical protein
MVSHLSVRTQHPAHVGWCFLFHIIFLHFAWSVNLWFFATSYLVRTIMDQNSTWCWNHSSMSWMSCGKGSKLTNLTRNRNSHSGPHICGWFKILWPMTFLLDGTFVGDWFVWYVAWTLIVSALPLVGRSDTLIVIDVLAPKHPLECRRIALGKTLSSARDHRNV